MRFPKAQVQMKQENESSLCSEIKNPLIPYVSVILERSKADTIK